MLKKNKIFLCASVISSLVTSVYAVSSNFNCPQPGEIQSTDFTAPSIWVAPAVAHSAPGTIGIGLGGKEVKEFLGAEAAVVNHKKGWVCVYHSAAGLSVQEYKEKIRQVTESTPYLKKYLAKINEAFEKAEPYLKKYPQHTALGFVGYQESK